MGSELLFLSIPEFQSNGKEHLWDLKSSIAPDAVLANNSEKRRGWVQMSLGLFIRPPIDLVYPFTNLR